jgi:hypothetical protein
MRVPPDITGELDTRREFTGPLAFPKKYGRHRGPEVESIFALFSAGHRKGFALFISSNRPTDLNLGTRGQKLEAWFGTIRLTPGWSATRSAPG